MAEKKGLGNSSLMRNLVKSFLPSIDVKMIDSFISNQLNSIELKDGEVIAAFMITEVKEVPMFHTIVLNDDDQVVRLIKSVKVSEFVNNLLQNF